MNFKRRARPKGKARYMRLTRRSMRRKRAGSDALHDTMRDGRRRGKTGAAR